MKRSTENPFTDGSEIKAGGANSNSFGAAIQQTRKPATPAGRDELIAHPPVRPGAIDTFFVNRKVRKEVAHISGEIMIAQMNHLRDVALQKLDLQVAAIKQRLLRDYLETGSEVARQIMQLNHAAESELTEDFASSRRKVLVNFQRRLEAIEELAARGVPDRFLDAERATVERWCEIELSNIEARLELTLRRYAAQFTQALDSIGASR